MKYFFWKHPILEPRFRSHNAMRMIFRNFFDPKLVTNLKFNLSQKNFEKMYVEKFRSRIKIEKFQFLKSNFWVTWQILRDIKSTSESQISWILEVGISSYLHEFQRFFSKGNMQTIISIMIHVMYHKRYSTCISLPRSTEYVHLH